MSTGTSLSPDHILIDHADDAFPVVTINRPEKRNCVSFAMWSELARVFDELSSMPAVRAIILTGAGGSFCAGADISEFDDVRASKEDAERYEHAVEASNEAISKSPKATIAAISGACVGGGCGLALACDFRIVDETAYFAIPASRLSIVYDLGETRNLLNAVGFSKAKEILFTGRRYAAQDALEINLIDRIDGPDGLAAAKAYAEAMRHSAPLTIAGAKTMLDVLSKGDAEERRDEMSEAMARSVESADYQEGVRAFAEKRNPVFRGV
ncbi:MAG: enoyl-CoA hydratase-related protein [Pseudomonadota bacterium]